MIKQPDEAASHYGNRASKLTNAQLQSVRFSLKELKIVVVGADLVINVKK